MIELVRISRNSVRVACTFSGWCFHSFSLLHCRVTRCAIVILAVCCSLAHCKPFTCVLPLPGAFPSSLLSVCAVRHSVCAMCRRALWHAGWLRRAAHSAPSLPPIIRYTGEKLSDPPIPRGVPLRHCLCKFASGGGGGRRSFLGDKGGGGARPFLGVEGGGGSGTKFLFLMAKNCPGGSKMPLILYKEMQNRYRMWQKLSN